jgi:secreted PhoX family phosphatase
VVNHEETPGGVSVLTLEHDDQGWQLTESRSVSFDGVRGHSTWNNCSGTATPWGTVLSGEEYPPSPEKLAAVAPAAAEAGRPLSADPMDYGWMVEIDPKSGKALRKLEALGRFSHEGAAVLPDGRTVLMGDDERGGLIFKFVADQAGDLSAGKLSALQLTGDKVSWVDIPAEKVATAREAGKAAGATAFHRPEDIEYNPVDGMVYIAETGDEKQAALADQVGRVWRLDLTGNRMTVFIQGDPSGIVNPDNLAIRPDNGDILLHEDRYDHFLAPTPGMPNNSLWFADLKARMKRFATLPEGAEGTGGAFASDGTLFFNVQHPDAPWRSSVIQVLPPFAAGSS